MENVFRKSVGKLIKVMEEDYGKSLWAEVYFNAAEISM